MFCVLFLSRDDALSVSSPIDSIKARISSIASMYSSHAMPSGRLGYKGVESNTFSSVMDEVSGRVSSFSASTLDSLGLRETPSMPDGAWADRARQLGNGRLSSDMLTPISQSGHRLAPFAANDWDALVKAAASDGVPISITDSYRNFDQQVDLAARKGLYELGGLAAVPGTSQHGWGMAVDVNVDTDPRVKAWLNENAHRFGWVSDVPREPWHYEWRK